MLTDRLDFICISAWSRHDTWMIIAYPFRLTSWCQGKSDHFRRLQMTELGENKSFVQPQKWFEPPNRYTFIHTSEVFQCCDDLIIQPLSLVLSKLFSSDENPHLPSNMIHYIHEDDSRLVGWHGTLFAGQYIMRIGKAWRQSVSQIDHQLKSIRVGKGLFLLPSK
jgi:hypothetical protein